MVAGHAFLIFRRGRGEVGANLVTNTALFLDRPGRIKPAHIFISDAGLVVGIMATNTVSIFVRILNLDGPMRTLSKVIHDGIMTVQTLVRSKEISPALGHIKGIGVEVLVRDIFMALLTGGLAVCRYMIFLGINKP